MLAAMARVPYDPEHIARFFDEYGTREWSGSMRRRWIGSDSKCTFDSSASTSTTATASSTHAQEHVPARLGQACREPGALDGGTHILAVVQRI
jgi:hypothetical protein